MHLTLLTNLLRLSLDRLVFIRTTGDRDGVNFLMRLTVPFVESWEVRSALPLCLQRTPCFVQNSSIEIFFGRPSAWYRNQRLSKSLLLYTICLILKTSPKVSFSHFIHKMSKLTVYLLMPLYYLYISFCLPPAKNLKLSERLVAQ